MANRNFPAQRIFGMHMAPVRLDGTILIGSSGAVTSFTGIGIAAVTHDGTGVYKIQMQDNYASFLMMNTKMIGTVTGSAIDPNGGVVGTLYQITTVGTTNWVTAGIPSGITATVGQVFALAAAPTAATGRVKLYLPSAITSVQPAGNPNTAWLNKQPFTAGSGGYVTMLCQGATDATHTALIPTDPASGETIVFEIMLNNSSVQ